MKRNLTLEESKKLVELGYSIKLATAGSIEEVFYHDDEDNLHIDHDDCRCFSLADLISFLPQFFVFENCTYSLMISPYVNVGWSVEYFDAYNSEFLISESETELIDAIVNALIDLKNFEI